MKYKIQAESLWGWSDLKTSIDGSDYEVEIFDQLQDAQDEIDMIIDNLDADSKVRLGRGRIRDTSLITKQEKGEAKASFFFLHFYSLR